MHWLKWEELCWPKGERGLGLRDIGVFNSALQAKQGWRLLNESDTLLARTLKARYCPRGKFFNASPGYNLSYTWQSMLDGRRVLELGLVWVVGNSCSVRVEQGPWLLGDGNPCIEHVHGELSIDCRARDLMTVDFSSWNVSITHQLFDQAYAS